MLTFKQMEALYWIVQLGSFDAAATRLNTTQSAVSKRIQELERAFDLTVFDRAHRSARLTDKGAELFDHAKALLEQRDRVVERMSSKEALVRHVRIGVTELTALTWLPRLIAAIQAAYPRVHVEAEVDLTATLRDRLAADTIDLIVVPQIHATDAFMATVVGEVDNAWMCAAGFMPTSRAALALTDIARFPLILQGNLSGTGHLYTRFLQEHGVATQRVLSSNSLLAQIGLTLSGLGISYLPKACVAHLVACDALEIVRTQPALPPVRYVALHRAERAHSLTAEIVRLAEQACDFSTSLLDPRAHD
ncbi:LysR family transcriptional regulator [Burkholderia cenocepacia]|uniref:LysR family transcriptional regulator n=1 Tax=Burkholderia cepacia complex TaxID=87882 RepID=UPI000F572E4C|nr:MULTISPECIES: LysR family transcriptional regulator [Burkholderia cepacia complex]ELW9450157.1 LysR family transcriptional regulator [Burkholderia cenocepacia]MBR8486178.1 LysR family transcriptional regulator [Burkholderia cenocepacia]MDN7471881.1 LysR family transcriptional regulator [Burkholderia orbicola]MDN7501656.1 LysR family transcriptional regulator [Burkholderia orbicola]RQU18394.1 LysR family transcriptional regulator [Burkholderia cenocepacia]